MITEYFKWGKSLSRVLATPAGPYLSSISEEMKAQGFSYWILRRRLQGAAHFSHWNQQQGKSIEQLHEDMLGNFAAHLGTCRCRTPLRLSRYEDVRLLAGAKALVDYLRRNGTITSAPPSNTAVHPPTLVAGFLDWMRIQRGVRESTLPKYGTVVEHVLEVLGADPQQYRAESIRRFIISRTQGKSQGVIKEVVTITRMFLRYLIAQGSCRPGMDYAVPTVAMWRLAALPRWQLMSSV